MREMEGAGMDAASLAGLRDAAASIAAVTDDGAFDGVWRENAGIVEAFLSVSTQWRIVACGGGGAVGPGGGAMAPIMPFYAGLDYAAVRVALDARRIEVTPKLWTGLQVMEMAAVVALNEDLD